MAEDLVTQLIDILKSWAKKHNTKQFSNFYLFGSLLNEGGNQFLPDRSDIDLIAILQNPNSLNIARVCQKLQKAKLELELHLRSILPRKNKPKPNDFDLLLLHELLFDKASALLKRNSSITLSKGTHPSRDRGNLPAPPAAKMQSDRTPEAKTKSKSSTVDRAHKKTASAATTKPATANKTSTTAQKTPVSTTSRTRSTGTVKEPKGWVMLNEKFFLTKSIVTQPDRSIDLQLLPTADMEQVAELKSLHRGEFHNKKQITYADKHEAGIMQVSSVLSESIAGKIRFNITLTPTQRSQNNGFAISVIHNNNYSTDKIAELRARRILLGEPLPKDLEPLFPTTQVEKGIFPELWVKLQTQPRLFLPKAWLKAAYSLKMSGIVEDVLELELGTIKNKVMPVRFRGRRQAYTDQKPSIEFEGRCTLDA